MEEKSFQDLRVKVFELHRIQEYERALALLNAEGGQYPTDSGDIAYWRACFKALLGRNEEALDELEGELDRGFWWQKDMLLGDPDLNSLHGHSRFERIIARGMESFALAQKQSVPELKIFEPTQDSPIPYPLLFALHARGSNASNDGAHWSEAANLGFLVALPQSSQLFSPNRFCWDDEETSRSEIQAHLNVLFDREQTDPEKIVLGGFSQGAMRAVQFAAEGVGNARGFIVVAPSFRDFDDLDPHLQSASDRGLRGYIVAGSKDERFPLFGQLQELLKAHGIACQLELHPELGHAYPADFSATLHAATEFILE